MKISIKKFWNIFLLLFCISNTKIVKPGVENEYKKQQLIQNCKFDEAKYFALKSKNKFCIKEGLFFEISPEDEILNSGNIEMDLQLSNKNIVHKFLLENDEFVKYRCKKSKKNSNFICDGRVFREVLAAKDKKGKLLAIKNLGENIKGNINDRDFLNRFALKVQIKDFIGVKEDMNRVYELNSTYNVWTPNEMKYFEGLLYILEEDYKQSIKYFDELIAISSQKETKLDLAELYWTRAFIKFALENINGAIIDAEKAVRLSPKDPNKIYYLGLYNYYQSNYSTALDRLNAVYDLNNDFYLEKNDFLIYLGKANLESGNYLLAISDFTKYLDLNPNSESYINRGQAYENLGFFDLAFKDYSEAIKLDPNFWLGYLYRGYLNFNQDKYIPAKKDFEKMYEFSPDEIKPNAYTVKVIGNIFAFLEKYSIEDPELDFEKFSSYHSQKLKIEYQKLLNECTSAIKIDKDSPPYFARAVLYKFAYWIPKNYLLALDDINKAIELNPDKAYLFTTRGQIKLKLNRNESAMEDFNLAINLNPESRDAYSSRGELKKKLKDFRGALDDKSKKNKLRSIELDSLLN